MKRVRSTLALAVPLALLLAPVAQAIPTFSLVWQETGTSIIAVSTTTSQRIVADLVFELEAGDTAIFFSGSFLFDEDLADELDFVSFRERIFIELLPGVNYGPLGFGPLPNRPPVESSLAVGGLVSSFDFVPQAGFSTVPVLTGPLTLTLGTIAFQTNATRIANDGIDARFDFLANGLDGYQFGDFAFCPSASTPCPVNFLGASVNAPEPTTATLLVAGLALGAFAESRRRC